MTHNPGTGVICGHRAGVTHVHGVEQDVLAVLRAEHLAQCARGETRQRGQTTQTTMNL